MTDLRQAATLALEALERYQVKRQDFDRFADEITALKAALAQPEQEPVACRFCHSKKGCWTWQCYNCGEIDDVQKPPPAPQRPWQGLTPEDLAQIESDEFWQVGNHMAIAMAVEAKLKEKNDH
jgi:hypothetical protein